MICCNCGEVEGVVHITKQVLLCAECAALHIRTLGSVAEDRAKSWQTERIRAERLAAVNRELLAACEGLICHCEEKELFSGKLSWIFPAFCDEPGDSESFDGVRLATMRAAIAKAKAATP